MKRLDAKRTASAREPPAAACVCAADQISSISSDGSATRRTEPSRCCLRTTGIETTLMGAFAITRNQAGASASVSAMNADATAGSPSATSATRIWRMFCRLATSAARSRVGSGESCTWASAVVTNLPVNPVTLSDSARARGPASINMRPTSTASQASNKAANSRFRRLRRETLRHMRPLPTSAIRIPWPCACGPASRNDCQFEALNPLCAWLHKKPEGSEPMRVLIVDDHPIVVSGCRALLGVDPAIEVIDASDGETGYSAYFSEQTDVAVIDINLPGVSGLELCRRILQRDPLARLIVFSMNDDPLLFLDAVRRVAGGGVYLRPEMAREVAFIRVGSGGNPLSHLSAREVEILRLLAAGNSMSQIAHVLNVSYKTVANNCTALKHKLGARSAMDLMRIAVDSATSSTHRAR